MGRNLRQTLSSSPLGKYSLHLDIELEAYLTMLSRYGGPCDSLRDVCGVQVTDKVKLTWGLTEEGEVSGIWRDSGHDGVWF